MQFSLFTYALSTEISEMAGKPSGRCGTKVNLRITAHERVNTHISGVIKS